MYTNEQMETKVQEFLKLVTKDKKLSKLYTFKIDLDKKVDSQLLIKLITEPFLIGYDESDGILYFINDDGERQNCPEIQEGVSTSRDWISDFLPAVPFDISQGGNLRRASEAENIYKCILISGILKGEFESKFLDACKNYNFEDLKPKDGTIDSFSTILSSWQELQNLTIQIIVSGANYKISSEKNLEAGFIIGSLNKEETLGVISIRDRVKGIIRSYMLNELSPNNISSMTKIDRLIKIQEKDNMVLSEINSSSKYSELYKICSMNSDYLSAGVKNTLSNSSSNFARKESSLIFKDDESGFKKFISVCRRRAYKEAVISMKEKELIKWRDVGNLEYKLPSKR